MRIKKTIITSILFTVGLQTLVIGQVGDEKKAKVYLADGNFEAALDEYLLLMEDNANDATFNYNVGVCYLNTNIDKSKAVKYFETAMKLGYGDNNLNYTLGMAYHVSGEFDLANSSFQKFKQNGGGSAASTEVVNKQIEYIQNAKELMKYPLDVSFENLGDLINTEFPEYYPFVPTDQSYIAFNSKRDDGSVLQKNGSYTSNVYLSSVEEGKFKRAFPLGEEVNSSDGNEEICGLSADGNTMLLYFDNWDGFGDLYISGRVGGKFRDAQLIGKSVNSSFQEIAACISPDGEQIYFASNRKGGYGGTDIYVVRKLPTGEWGDAQNLGKDVNTMFDEDFPNLSPDGKELYFSSKGHTSMGGYDIFKATFSREQNKYVNAVNLGYPINTTWDDMNYRLAEPGKFGYIAAVRPEGFGDYDIYRVNYNNIEPRYTVMKGIIIGTDSTKAPLDVMITVTDSETGDIVGDYLPNLETMRYIIILPPGKYTLAMDATGYVPYTKQFTVFGKSTFVAEMQKDIQLTAE